MIQKEIQSKIAEYKFLAKIVISSLILLPAIAFVWWWFWGAKGGPLFLVVFGTIQNFIYLVVYSRRRKILEQFLKDSQ